MTKWSECAICGIEDCCLASIEDIDSRTTALLIEAFKKYRDKLENEPTSSGFLRCVDNAFVDGHLRNRNQICRFVLV